MKTPVPQVRCPSCGEPAMVAVTRDVTTRAGNKMLIVKGVEVEECGRCGERLYDLAALRRIREARRARTPSRAA